jgi:hypothetical protein
MTTTPPWFPTLLATSLHASSATFLCVHDEFIFKKKKHLQCVGLPTPPRLTFDELKHGRYRKFVNK